LLFIIAKKSNKRFDLLKAESLVYPSPMATPWVIIAHHSICALKGQYKYVFTNKFHCILSQGVAIGLGYFKAFSLLLSIYSINLFCDWVRAEGAIYLSPTATPWVDCQLFQFAP